jgi:hypothetical protein
MLLRLKEATTITASKSRKEFQGDDMGRRSNEPGVN